MLSLLSITCIFASTTVHGLINGFVKSNKKYTWPQAEAWCNIYDSHLATITDMATNVLVAEKCGDSRYCWIGAHDQNFEDTWEWIDGTVWDGKFNMNTANTWGDEDCMEIIWYDGHWNDKKCRAKRYAICNPLSDEQYAALEADFDAEEAAAEAENKSFAQEYALLLAAIGVVVFLLVCGGAWIVVRRKKAKSVTDVNNVEKVVDNSGDEEEEAISPQEIEIELDAEEDGLRQNVTA